MKALLEIHLLQNFAPSNLNRDDTGSPKDAYFGGVRRGRISSQSLKRAMRMYFKEQADTLIPAENLAVRTKRLSTELVGLLEQRGKDATLAQQVVQMALGGLALKVDEKDNKTQYLVFFGRREIAALVQTIDVHWEQLTAALGKDDGGKKKDKKAAKDGVPKEVVQALEAALDGGRAVDVALFGRMLADLPEKNQFAAAQVAHAISTHKVEHGEDFYTAVDDLKPDDNAGADMLGTVEFNSACYYRYVAVDLQKLAQNLQCLDEHGHITDPELLFNSITAFLKAVMYALPTGKQNTFAAHQVPSVAAFTVRTNASPRSLANAFEKAISPSNKGWLDPSAAALLEHWKLLDSAYGQTGKVAILNLTHTVLGPEFKDSVAGSVEKLIETTVANAKLALGV